MTPSFFVSYPSICYIQEREANVYSSVFQDKERFGSKPVLLVSFHVKFTIKKLFGETYNIIVASLFKIRLAKYSTLEVAQNTVH